MHFNRCLAVVAIAMGCGCTQANGAAAESTTTTTTSGALTVDWTIRGSADASQCVASAASAIEITVLDRANVSVGSFQQSCNAFSTSINLEAGLYSATARLLDAAGAPRTRVVALESITLYGNSQLTSPIDFPANVFF